MKGQNVKTLLREKFCLSKKTFKIDKINIDFKSDNLKRFFMKRKLLKLLLPIELKKLEKRKMRKSADLELWFRIRKSKGLRQLTKRMRR